MLVALENLSYWLASVRKNVYFQNLLNYLSSFCPKLCPFSYNIGIDKKRFEMNERKLSVTVFSPEKIFVTITLKMHDFHVSKVSGANGVLDIYRIQPVHNWIGNLLGWFSSSFCSYFYYDISSEYFRLKT